MKYSDVLTDLNRVLFYTAPANCSPIPYQISSGIQLLEVILDGVVYFEIDHNHFIFDTFFVEFGLDHFALGTSKGFVKGNCHIIAPCRSVCIRP